MEKEDHMDISKYFDGYSERFNRLVRYSRSWGMPRENAEDLAQAAYMKAVAYVAEKYLPKLDTPVLHWAHRKIICDEHRQKKEMTELSDYIPDSKQLEPSILIEDKEQANVLYLNISRLPKPYKQVVTQRYLEEKSFKEIASALERKEATVRVMLFRALSQLRQMDW